MRPTARPDQKQIVPALAVTRQVDLDANEQVGAFEHFELRTHTTHEIVTMTACWVGNSAAHLATPPSASNERPPTI
jgi:hypothetical protein